MEISPQFTRKASDAAKPDELVVYHGSWSDRPPHEYLDDDDFPAFHAGSPQSAQDRLFSEENIPFDGGHFQAVHAYAIPKGRIDPTVFADPHPEGPHSDLPKMPAYPEDIKQYKNEHEDAGATSYYVPAGSYRHLATQFDIEPYDRRNDPVVQAYRSMTGGPTDVG